MIPLRRFLPAAVAIVAIGVGLMISGCIQAPGPAVPINPTVPFSEEAFAPFLQPGTGRIQGSAFLKTAGGDVKLAAGNTIELMPATPHTINRYHFAVNGAFMAPRDPRIEKHIRRTVGDAQGNFEFSGLPAGDYILSCNIWWLVSSNNQSGGQALAFVSVKEGETTKAVVTR